MKKFEAALRRLSNAAALGITLSGIAVGGANAFSLCALASTTTYDEASRALEQSGCVVSQETGTSKRTFGCPNGQWASVASDAFGASIVVSGPPQDSLDAVCSGQRWRSLPVTFDNPLVSSVYSLSGKGQIAIVSLDGRTPLLTQICTDTYLCGTSLKRALAATLKERVGDGTLNFSSSEIRIAGLDITEARRETLERELLARGAIKMNTSGGPLVSDAVYGQVSGVPGLSEIQVKYLLDRIALVRYPIAGEQDYLTFASSLDARYGASRPSQTNGCVNREWRNGGVTVIGQFCSGKPRESGFLFANNGAMAIVDGLGRMVATAPVKLPAAPKPRTDMY